MTIDPITVHILTASLWGGIIGIAIWAIVDGIRRADR